MNQLSIVAILLLGLSMVFAQNVGVALITGTNNDPTIKGTVKFTQLNDSFVRVDVSISGITQNLDADHGMHVHQYGDLQNQTNGGLSVGSHFAGAGSTTHGCETSETRHEGDMGNWAVDADGNISASKELNLLALTGGNSIVGLAVVVHQLTDDCYNITSSGKRLGWGVVGIAGSTGNAAVNGATPTRASCILSAAAANVTGQIFLETTSDSTRIWGYVDGLTAGTSHGFHIHVYGDITNMTGTNAGGHYNPTNVAHALPPATTRHVGDLPNLSTYEGNRAWFDYTSNLVSLSGANSVIGRAIIVHEKADDGCTQPTGNSGSRYAQCVIGVGTSDVNFWNPPTVAVQVPAPQQVSCGPSSAPTAPNTPGKASLAAQHAVELLLAFVLMVLAF